MRATTLRRRGLTYYWRTNVAVVAGVAIAVAVLAGALTVGTSVRASLRDLVVQRLGETDHVITSPGFFREDLASEIAADKRFSQRFAATTPLIALEGFVTDQTGGRRASHVQVYAIDDRFWAFHHTTAPSSLDRNDAFLSDGLAREIATTPGQSVVLRVESASAIPTESLHGRKEDVGRTVRLTVRQILPADRLGEFSFTPRQGSIHAIFVPLRRLQSLLQQPNKVNAILISALRGVTANAAENSSAIIERIVVDSVRLEDLGLRLRALEERRSLALESSSTVLSDKVAATARRIAEQQGMQTQPTLTYLANTIRSGAHEIPYSVITALDLNAAGFLPRAQAQSQELKTPGQIVLNTWAANELQARVGDPISIDYYVWETQGRLSTRSAEFRVAAIVPIEGSAADRNLVPDYPGITDSDRLADWDPPFPIDLRRVRPADEDYWKRYRATPKAFIAIDEGQRLWRSQYGALTSLRVRPAVDMPLGTALDRYERALRSELDPSAAGISVQNVRALGLAASSGTTDFSEYFTYFSMFLVVSALLLAALFFKLGVEQRLREIGLLQALGFEPAAVRRLFVGEGLILSIAGGLFGMVGAIAYGAAIMFGLRTWWIGAVGTTVLRLHVDLASLVAGAVAGIVVSILCIWWSLRSFASVSSRSLLAGQGVHRRSSIVDRRSSRRWRMDDGRWTMVCALLTVVVLAGAMTGSIGRVAGFFSAGAFALITMFCAASAWLRTGHHRTIQGHGVKAVWQLGVRNATIRPGRSVLCIALIAFATFVIVAVEAFKRGTADSPGNRQSGTGGYSLLVDSLLPIVYDLNDGSARDAMNLPARDLEGVHFDRFRVRPGDDTSCLNLYQPKNPRILSVSPDFVNAGRFTFQQSLADTPEEIANPWRLLNREYPDGAIPVFTDANSMTYVLHLKLGDDLILPGTSDRPVRLRLVGALSDSVFQGELLMAESPFVRTFPEWEGYRFFLADVPADRSAQVSAILESRLSDFGVDAVSSAERLAGFHRVEYTYLLTFQVLGGLGLILGTLGLAAVLLRNVLERRRELALLRALGYRQADFFGMVLAENVLLLICGLAAGTFCAFLAVAPALVDRGGRLGPTMVLLLVGVLATGLLASIGATAAALRGPLLPALRAE